MFRRVLILLCLAVLASTGVVRPWRDHDNAGRRHSVDAATRGATFAASPRDKVQRAPAPFTAAARIMRDVTPVGWTAAATAEPPAPTAPQPPLALRPPGRAPPPRRGPAFHRSSIPSGDARTRPPI